GPRPRQQHVHRGAQHGHVLPLPRGGDAHRHVRRPLVRHRLQGADRRAPGLRGGIDLRGRGDRHRGPAGSPRASTVGQLDEGPAPRAVRPALRAADLPEEPLPQARAHEAQGVPRASDPPADPPDARPRDLEAAGALAGRRDRRRPGHPARGAQRSACAAISSPTRSAWVPVSARAPPSMASRAPAPAGSARAAAIRAVIGGVAVPWTASSGTVRAPRTSGGYASSNVERTSSTFRGASRARCSWTAAGIRSNAPAPNQKSTITATARGSPASWRARESPNTTRPAPPASAAPPGARAGRGAPPPT